jgi:hypothetical protein
MGFLGGAQPRKPGAFGEIDTFVAGCCSVLSWVEAVDRFAFKDSIRFHPALAGSRARR